MASVNHRFDNTGVWISFIAIFLTLTCLLYSSYTFWWSRQLTGADICDITVQQGQDNARVRQNILETVLRCAASP